MRRILAGLLFTSLAAYQATAADLGPFSAVPGRSDAIVLKGDITGGLAIQFFNALEAFPGTRTIVLDSLGGSVHDALMDADMLHKRNSAKKEARWASAE